MYGHIYTEEGTERKAEGSDPLVEAPIVDDNADFSFFSDMRKKDHCYKHTETIYSIKVYVKNLNHPLP
jgi:hypothetical protein